MGGNGLIVRFGEVMPMRLGRLQRRAGRSQRIGIDVVAGWADDQLNSGKKISSELIVARG